MKSVTIRRWFNRHLHLRDGKTMERVLPCTLNQGVTGAIIMPNLPDPVSTIDRAKAYRDRITDILPEDSDFEPCMTCYLTDETPPEEVVQGFKEGTWKAVKLYLTDQKGKGGTTGSVHGVSNLPGRYPVFEEMEKSQIPLLGHYEAVEEEVDEFEREIRAIEQYLLPILERFPGLPVVVEHITDGRTADFIADWDHPGGLFGTVTPHHMILNRNAMFRGGMNPGYYCKPVPKSEEHRQKVREYVTSGHPRFGAGTDSAPHHQDAKSKCYGSAAGIFCEPVAIGLYAEIFEADNALDHLSPFLAKNFLHIYGMEVSQERVTLVRDPHKIPETIGGIPVFYGGYSEEWRIQ